MDYDHHKERHVLSLWLWTFCVSPYFGRDHSETAVYSEHRLSKLIVDLCYGTTGSLVGGIITKNMLAFIEPGLRQRYVWFEVASVCASKVDPKTC